MGPDPGSRTASAAVVVGAAIAISSTVVVLKVLVERVVIEDGRATAVEFSHGGEKLRAEGMCCQRVHLFVRTSPFDERAPYYSEQAGVRLVCPSDDTRLLLQQVNVLLPQI